MTIITSPNHIPVMPDEVLSFMQIKPSGKYIDGTCGLGGHSKAILSNLSNNGFLLGLDIDDEAIKICRKNLSIINSNFHIEKKSYSNFPKVLSKLGIKKVDGILLDLGLSSLQLDSKSRGFSFMEDSKLDMRFNQKKGINAAEIINRSSMSELADIMYYFGEERRSRLIAKKIFENRPIEKVHDLVSIIKKCTPPNKRNKTMARVFQSFRIAVNDELENLKKFMEKYIKYLKTGGKIIVISFHSLEDRIVKHCFRDGSKSGEISILTKKPIVSSKMEQAINSRSKSAKLRCAVKI
tara:strand:+ start:67 stop:951 length:885 start_codon:yes stop_codon:yes gene_type:complete